VEKIALKVKVFYFNI